MGQCNRCNGWMDGYGLCPECRRNDDLAEEQRSIAYEQAAEQERIQRQVQEEAHLNEIKRKLLDHAIEGLEDRETAAQKVAVLMRGSDFSGNLNWFWGDVSANAFLTDVYFGIVLEPLTSRNMSESEAIKVFDGLDYRARGVLGVWLDKRPADSSWQKKALPLYRAYEKVQRNREIEQKKQNEENQRHYEQQQKENETHRAKEAARQQAIDRSVGFRSGLAAVAATALFLSGFVLSGFLKLPLWMNSANYTAVAAFAVLLLLCVFFLFSIARDYCSGWLRNGYVDDDFKRIIYWAAVVLMLFLTWRSWSSLEGPVRFALIAASFGLPFVPLLRGAIGSFAVGVAGGLISLIISYIAGGILSGAYGWVMKS
jgi:hypothetical protein